MGVRGDILFVIVKDEWMAGDWPIERRRPQREDKADERKIIFRARCRHSSKPDRFALALVEANGLCVTDAAGERDGLGEIHADFAGRVSIGTKGDRHMVFKRQLKDLPARINFLAIFPQAGGVEFDGAIGGRGGGQKFFVSRRSVLRWADAEFFWQIAVADEVK